MDDKLKLYGIFNDWGYCAEHRFSKKIGEHNTFRVIEVTFPDENGGLGILVGETIVELGELIDSHLKFINSELFDEHEFIFKKDTGKVLRLRDGSVAYSGIEALMNLAEIFAMSGSPKSTFRGYIEMGNISSLNTYLHEQGISKVFNEDSECVKFF